MPYLTCIGGQGVAGANDGGTGARGYWIFRRGAVLVIRYGPVQTRRARNVWIEWLHWREVRKPCRSAEAARKLLQETIHEKTRPGHGYARLATGVRIW
jgi:hypothetical protein